LERFDLYTPPKPFQTHKWLSITLAGTFAMVAICATSMTVSTMRKNHAAAKAAAAATIAAAAPVIAQPVADQAPLATTASPVAPVAVAAPVATAPPHRTHKTHGKPTAKVAAAKNAHAREFLAKHDVKNKKKRDEIDKLLGL
jgi:hypothetical protein